MKPNLYICHTAYQVLVDLLRAGRCAGKPHTMVLSASVPDTAALAARLDATGVVKTVLVDETRWPGTVMGLFALMESSGSAINFMDRNVVSRQGIEWPEPIDWTPPDV